MESFITWLFSILALPSVGLPAIFLVAFLSSTLLPMGSEPALFGYVALNPHMYWPAIVIASIGNTLGGMVDWWMGYAAKRAFVRLKARRRAHARVTVGSAGQGDLAIAHGVVSIDAPPAGKEAKPPMGARYTAWMRRFGPPLLLLSWLPVVGDPFCTLAGWLRLSWRACLVYIAIGKTLRYIAVTFLLLKVPESFWQGIFAPLKPFLLG